MAARTRDQNLDSLLDTMANVVGILVVLVAVTQLSVGDAVERIAERRGAAREIAPAEVARAAARVEEVEAAVVAAQGELEAHEASAARAGWLLEEIRPHLEDLEALAGPEATAGDVTGRMAAEEARERDRIAALEAEVDEARRRAGGLSALLGSVPVETRPKIARLPNPRAPPRGLSEQPVLCRYGRCALVDIEGLIAMLHRGVRDALGTDRAVTREDVPWLANLFSKKRMGSGNFYWAFENKDGRFFADVRWSDLGYGETLAELSRPDAVFVRALDALDPKAQYLRFFVWSDSFEPYLEARYVAEQRGWQIGWLPIDEDKEVGVNLLGPPRRRVLLD